MELTIIGLGVESGDISLKAFESIKNCDYCIVRTSKTPSTQFLGDMGIEYISLDDIYSHSRNFDTLTKNLAKEVLSYLKKGKVCYLVEGAVSEDMSSQILLAKVKDALVFEGVSKAKNALLKCGIYATTYTAVSAYDLSVFERLSLPLVVYDLDSQVIASDWKLKLMDLVGEEQEVFLYVDNCVQKLPLYEIDRFDSYDFSTALVIDKVDLLSKQKFDFIDLFDIVKLLRAPNGCPWDRVQTMDTIRKNLIEECYELADAIDLKDDDKILEEIGDVFLQGIFHAVFAEERNAFTLSDTLTDECKKLIFRHSHIFGTDKVSTSDGALDVWDKNKKIEKGFKTQYDYISDVPKSFPSLLRAQKTLKRILKSASEGLTQDEIINLIAEAVKREDADACGLLLLCVCYLLHLRGVDGEEALYFAVDKLVDSCHNCDGENFPLGDYFKKCVDKDEN